MVLYFTAAWCSPCKMFKPILQQVQSELGVNVNIIDVEGKNAAFYLNTAPCQIKTLVEVGINLNHADKKGKTVMYY